MAFERIKIWQEAMNLADEIREMALKFPPHEKMHLTYRLQQAADAVPLLIADGAMERTPAKATVFLESSLRSCTDIFCALHHARRRALIHEQVFTVLYEAYEGLRKGILKTQISWERENGAGAAGWHSIANYQNASR